MAASPHRQPARDLRNRTNTVARALNELADEIAADIDEEEVFAETYSCSEIDLEIDWLSTEQDWYYAEEPDHYDYSEEFVS